jgi:hypothetical protein
MMAVKIEGSFKFSKDTWDHGSLYLDEDLTVGETLYKFMSESFNVLLEDFISDHPNSYIYYSEETNRVRVSFDAGESVVVSLSLEDLFLTALIPNTLEGVQYENIAKRLRVLADKVEEAGKEGWKQRASHEN